MPTGRPGWFNCWKCRRGCTKLHHDGTRLNISHDCPHTQVRTGAHQPRGSKRRVRREKWEYRCTCGHTGWTNNKLVLKLPLAEGASDAQ